MTAYTVVIDTTNSGIQTMPIASLSIVVNSDNHADALQAVLEYIDQAVNLQTLAIATISP
jgi:hypothetical protein